MHKSLVPIEYAYTRKKKQLWVYKCFCGREKIMYKQNVERGLSKSCGCEHGKKISESKVRHGMSNSAVYRVWNGMKQRCINPNNSRYKDWGGRGIKVCERWKRFDEFWEDMKDGYKKGLTIDRIDNNGNYCKENCRWVTMQEQQLNRTNSRFIEENGKKIPLKNWLLKNNISRSKFYKKLSKLL